MTVPQFQEKWRGSTLTERSAAQQHFLDLCRLLGMPTPAEADREGSFYTFEKGARKTAGGQGFADVWWEDRFAWEYKRNHANLDAAYAQLLQYREDLGNPPILVVSDLERFKIHTNFTGTTKKVFEFTLDALDQPENLAILRQVFGDPYSLRPDATVEAVTEEAAARFGTLAGALHTRGIDPERAAHFLVQLLFCLFAEDVGLLPKGVFSKLLVYSAQYPADFAAEMQSLLGAMRDGGRFNLERIPRFNGGLFAHIEVVPLTKEELRGLAAAASLDWGSVEPAIFGTLFERSLDPGKRAQLGAHYTGRADIERVVEPVVMAPLRRRWGDVRAEADTLKAAWGAAAGRGAQTRARNAFQAKLTSFLEELSQIRILDPACGSGNFLYVALAALLDLEKEAIAYGAANGLPTMYPGVRPLQLHGLELNSYARELAQTVVWIGYLQWMIDNGFLGQPDPVLEPLETIRLQNALLDLSDQEQPKEAAWPEAEFIIGNPPFLGDKKMRGSLGDDYVTELRRIYKGRVPGMANLVCYFFEKARAAIEMKADTRAGLLATDAIRHGANREVLQRIKRTGDIFMAWPNEPWVLDGAAVRIAVIGFDDGTQQVRELNGVEVQVINVDLTSGLDITTAVALAENKGIASVGVQPTGPFDISVSTANEWIGLPVNPNGRPNRDVLKPYVNGTDITGRPKANWTDRWIIDFGTDLSEHEASLYQIPFEHALDHIKPGRAKRREARLRTSWWIYERPRADLMRAIEPLSRLLATSMVSTHRFYVWLPSTVVPANLLVIFARQDDYFFGVLQSQAHEVWANAQGSDLGKGDDPRYNVGRCFETFPLPWPPGQEAWRDPRIHAIADAAHELNDLREAWLNPPDAAAAELKKRTLTNLYNTRPAWLAAAHAALDRAVWAAYGWEDDPAETTDEEILERVLALNGERAGETN